MSKKKTDIPTAKPVALECHTCGFWDPTLKVRVCPTCGGKLVEAY